MWLWSVAEVSEQRFFKHQCFTAPHLLHRRGLFMHTKWWWGSDIQGEDAMIKKRLTFTCEFQLCLCIKIRSPVMFIPTLPCCSYMGGRKLGTLTIFMEPGNRSDWRKAEWAVNTWLLVLDSVRVGGGIDAMYRDKILLKECRSFCGLFFLCFSNAPPKGPVGLHVFIAAQ